MNSQAVAIYNCYSGVEEYVQLIKKNSGGLHDFPLGPLPNYYLFPQPILGYGRKGNHLLQDGQRSCPGFCDWTVYPSTQCLPIKASGISIFTSVTVQICLQMKPGFLAFQDVLSHDKLM